MWLQLVCESCFIRGSCFILIGDFIVVIDISDGDFMVVSGFIGGGFLVEWVIEL